ncbi:MAG: CehA/McbA family metallohydrolase [Butyrivibrio sp.]|nr:CehA/McbA family metallohydrolase [Butyrivibrio sp.]
MDRIINGFFDSGKWYKGNLHSHTTKSDGMLSPDKAVQDFRAHGYSFLSLTDHNQYNDYSQKYNCDDFILLPGIEAAAVLYDTRGECIRVHHINGILGTEEMQKHAEKELLKNGQTYGPFEYHEKWEGRKVAQDIIDDLHRRGCIVTYNHPIWSRIEPDELINLHGIDMLEIYNYNTENESGTGYDTSFWDMMLRRGVWQNADAADDNHNGGIFDDAFGGFIMVKAEELSQDGIVTAIRNGSYYSSSGPEIYDWDVNENNVNICCSPAVKINLIADGYVGAGTSVIARPGTYLEKCQIPIRGTEHYIRVECIDENGHVAWTNPIFTGK